MKRTLNYLKNVFGGRLNKERDFYRYEDDFCDIVVRKKNGVYVCETQNHEFGLRFCKYEICRDIDEVIKLVDEWIVRYCASMRNIVIS